MNTRYQGSESSKPTDLVASIVERIDRMIVQGELVSGQRLIETDLAAALGVGRAPLREAIRILVGDGALDLIPNRGARVKVVGVGQIAEMLKVAATLTFMGLDDYIVQKNFGAALRRLELLNRKIDAAFAAFDTGALYAAMQAYGNEIAAHSNNDYLRQVLARIHLSHHQRLATSMMSFADLAMMAPMYRNITAALRARDAEKAHRIVREGIKAYAERIVAAARKTPSVAGRKVRSRT